MTASARGGYIRIVKQLRALTPEEFARASERLRNPPPGSRIAAAKEYGIDLTLSRNRSLVCGSFFG